MRFLANADQISYTIFAKATLPHNQASLYQSVFEKTNHSVQYEYNETA